MTGKSHTSVGQQFEALFREYFTSLCYFAQKYVADQDSAREIVHTVFISVWDNRNNFDFDKPAKSYLFTSVYNRSMNFLRDRKKFVSDPQGTTEEEQGAPDPDYMAEAELESRIWKVIDSLPDKCREVFVLSRFDGLKYAEIAGKLNVSVKTVETQMTRALKALRIELKDYLIILWIIMINFFR